MFRKKTARSEERKSILESRRDGTNRMENCVIVRLPLIGRVASLAVTGTTGSAHSWIRVCVLRLVISFVEQISELLQLHHVPFQCYSTFMRYGRSSGAFVPWGLHSSVTIHSIDCLTLYEGSSLIRTPSNFHNTVINFFQSHLVPRCMIEHESRRRTS